ncbi:MAG: SH3 domain-containing protein, partial [Gemmatimonadota bacterium]|nr:SH3 domain-containing protein [Gemmatimonadota bacterium]
ALLQGFLLDRVEESEGWVRVRRTGWVRSAALQPVLTGGLPGTPASRAVERPPAVVADGRELLTGDSAIQLRRAPDADAVATVEPGIPITVVERGGRWTRVRIEGWVPTDQLVTSDPDSVVVDVSAGAIKANPDAYTGMRVRWQLQFIAMERAEPERVDFYEGEPFMLARAPDPGDGFVYVTVPPELLEAAMELRPLAMVDMLARVRTGRSSLMGVPVLDLLALF